MAASDLVTLCSLKREDCSYDSGFSQWKVLVGPSDWKDYSLGKEGAERYRVHNLPPSSGTGPGVYELGIAVPLSPIDLGRDIRKLDQHRIVVVYLGQADNVRSRLQQYGRTGAHLGNGCSAGLPVDCKAGSLSKGPGLFEMMFSKGYFIVYRWAPAENKKDAERREAQLLNKYDYALNKSKNGARRCYDILQKLNNTASSTAGFRCISQKLVPFSQKQCCTGIKTSKSLATKNIFSYSDDAKINFPSVVIKFSRSQPRLVSDGCGLVRYKDSIPICGFILGDGTPCPMPPHPGRKRCEEHKWKKVHGSTSKSVTEGNMDLSSPVVQDNSEICGYIGNGIFCTRRPVVGGKRCEEHKWMKVKGLTSKSTGEEKIHCPTITSGFTTSDGWMYSDIPSKIIKSRPLQPRLLVDTSSRKEEFSATCGATCEDGSSCRRRPSDGNKRCWQHKGKKADSSFSSFYTPTSYGTCGVTLRNGNVCMRIPPRGRVRCEQHKGMRL